MKILELFSGTESFGKLARSRGHKVITIDINSKFNPTICKDINNMNYIDFDKDFDLIWASPPCEQYSHAKRTGKRDLENANKNVLKTLEIIKQLKPKFWIIENPQTGLLKSQEFMKDIPFTDVSYCKYGFPYRKQTRLWNNFGFIGKICKKDCNFMNGKKHILSVGNARAMYCLKEIKELSRDKFDGEAFELIERLTKHGVNIKDKYKLPKELCKEILNQIEITKKLGDKGK